MSQYQRRNQKFKDLNSLSKILKQCYRIVWSVGKIQKVKIQML